MKKLIRYQKGRFHILFFLGDEKAIYENAPSIFC